MSWRILMYLVVPAATGLAYLNLAKRFNLLDRPNSRSSHQDPVVRGGGIVFSASWMAYSIFNGFAFPLFTAGLMLVSLVSFFDDIRSLKPSTRFISHLVAFALCCHELAIWGSYPPSAVALFFVIGIGALNAINFMDGINGMTGMYAMAMFIALVMPLSGFRWNIESIESSPIIAMASSVAVFGWFNFRKRALCFAGDVGSISIGLFMIFILLAIMTGQETRIGLSLNDGGSFRWQFILFIAVYGVDSVVTILHRIALRENIFEAHRRHLFQYLVNQRGMTHLSVALTYALVQFSIDLAVLGTHITPAVFILILGCLCLTYLWFRFIRTYGSDVDSNRT